MTLHCQFEALRKWAFDEICSRIKFKKADDDENTNGYDEDYVHPAVFSFFAPKTEDAKKLGIDYFAPSMCVQLLSGEDHVNTRMRELKVRLLLSVWNPGIHKEIDFVAYKGADDDYAFDFYRPGSDSAAKSFDKAGTGALDIQNFLDLTLSKVEENRFPAGLSLYTGVDKEKVLRYGFIWGDDLATEPYPYWYAWVEMTLLSRLEDIKVPDEDDLLA